MRLLIKGGWVLRLDGSEQGGYPADVLVEDGAIAAIMPAGSTHEQQADQLLDAEGKLVMPGLVNAHMHSETNVQKGMFEGLPLEVWLPQIIPVFGAPELPVRATYLSAALGAVHLLKRGVTTVVDHWIDSVPLMDGFDAVVDAYSQVGIRAVVGIDYSNVPLHRELPGLGQLLPAELANRLTTAVEASLDGGDYLSLCRTLAERYGGQGRRVRSMLGFSATARCTDLVLEGLARLSEETGLPLHGHMLETRTQSVSQHDLFPEGTVRHLQRLGLLCERLSVAHSIYVDQEDATLMGGSGVSAIHCPVSNLRLGSGVMPLKLLTSAGVNIALGTDGASSNDNLNMFEVMKLAAILHNLDTPDFTAWPNSAEVLGYATAGGARAVGLDGEIGSLEPGKRADIVMIDLRSTTYGPINHMPRQLVYSEDGANVETVVVDGEIVMRGGELTKIDERALLAEVGDMQLLWAERMRAIAQANRELAPYLETLHRQCIQEFARRGMRDTGQGGLKAVV